MTNHKMTDDAYERAEDHGGILAQTRSRCYYADRDIGDLVYLGHGDATKGRITGILIRPGQTTYLVTWADSRSENQHFGFELQDEPEIC